MLLFTIISTSSVFAQNNNVGIGTTTPNPTAVLDVTATDKGVLIPRLTTAQRNAIASPATGLMVYDTNLGCFYYFNSTAWISLCQAGPAGPQGPTGADGVTGPQGTQGAVGATGPQGANGANGATGPQGPQGVTGIDGVTGPQGPQGVAGVNGATGPQGVQGPTGANGAQGIQGPTGPQGVAGANGATGPQGLQGVAGANGATGPQGPQGVAGANGATGPQGAQGVQGAQGIQGIQGLQGVAGATGPTGPSWVNYQDNQTSAVTVTSATFQTLPGLSRTITLTSPAKIFVMTDGGIQTTSATTGGYSISDVVIHINGNWIADGGFKRLNAINNTGIVGAFAFWSMGVYATTTSGSYILPAGSYTITVQARLGGGSNATIGGDNTTVLQGVMQIFIIQ